MARGAAAKPTTCPTSAATRSATVTASRARAPAGTGGAARDAGAAGPAAAAAGVAASALVGVAVSALIGRSPQLPQVVQPAARVRPRLHPVVQQQRPGELLEARVVAERVGRVRGRRVERRQLGGLVVAD